VGYLGAPSEHFCNTLVISLEHHCSIRYSLQPEWVLLLLLHTPATPLEDLCTATAESGREIDSNSNPSERGLNPKGKFE
jgi:hypothetical protein